jgi:thiol-disulfide isomerase/thioredoxin
MGMPLTGNAVILQYMIRKSIVILICVWSSYVTEAQTVNIVKFDAVQKILSSKNDTTYVLNFWATWCIPCVKEFPAFQALAAKHHNEKVKVVMVSLDFKKDYGKTLTPYIVKHPIDASVYLLDEPDYNSWINKVDTSWGGEIPVTLIVKGSKGTHDFFAKDFTPASLEESFNQSIKNQQK